MNILVTGGAGYIGSHAVRHLIELGHQVVVLDNLSNGHREAISPQATFREGSIADTKMVKDLLHGFSIEAVMNFAAFIEVGESVADPYKYYENNFGSTLSLLKVLVECGVKKFVFSSTAAVYGIPSEVPIPETHSKSPLSPYGRSKLMVEEVLADFAKVHELSYAVLRYFNVAGAHPDSSIGEDHRPETHLIPRILCSALDTAMTLSVYGTDYPTPDGTCIRDYVHVQDLVRAHSLALEHLKPGFTGAYNLGSQSGFSVLEVIEACKKITKKNFQIQNHPRREGDSPVLIASSEKIKRELGWTPQYPALDTIIEHAWNWHRSHPQGYSTM